MKALSEFYIGDQVRIARNRLGLSLREISKRSGLSFDSVTKIASGINTNLRIRNLLKIADILKTDIKKILSPSDENHKFKSPAKNSLCSAQG